MKRILAALGLGALAFAPGALAQVTFYQYENFRGQPFSANFDIVNFDHYAYNDRASSVIIDRGQWQICEDANFQGRCVVLKKGQYPSLAAFGLNSSVSSLRRVKGGPPPAPPVAPPSGPAYPYYQQYGETLYQANVVAVRAVVGPPEQRCWTEQQYVQQTQPNVGGAVIGGILGGVLGHQIGSGRGNDVATAVGAVGGAALGANVNRGSGGYTQNVQKCQAVPGSEKVEYWDVTYVFRGVTHRAQLSFAPGATINVNGRGEPRV
jgi:uncharacterized protein YcfJ